jgi:methyl-accepting chemotaxis protein
MNQSDVKFKEFLSDLNRKADRKLEIVLVCYFLFGVFLCFFYDTWLVGFGVGFLNLILYFGTKQLFPEKEIHRYIASLTLGIFMAQFIYQMHGMFEMHFTALIAIIALVPHQNWKLFLPATIFIVVHHASFAYIQYLGVVNDVEAYRQIYFTQLEYMDLQTFIFHAGLVVIFVFLAVLHTIELEKESRAKAGDIAKMESNQVIMDKNIGFATDITNGEYDKEYNLHEGDKMGEALVNMRDSLIESSRRERKDRFINVGIAEVSNIIRDYSSNQQELAERIVAYLVKYLEVNQGGLFMIQTEGDREYLELKGMFAYNRKKFMQKQIEIGQGLVGQCYLEKEYIYLREIPEEYVEITSGLGDSTPTDLLLIPLKSNEQVTGVMEFASFKPFEDFHIEFLEKVGESLAAAISNLKTNATVKNLLEESQQQTEQLQAAEEEMRQNMEELEATQEESNRKTLEMEAYIGALNNSVATIEFDPSGGILAANDVFCKLMDCSTDQIMYKHHRIFLVSEETAGEEYEDFWRRLGEGESITGDFQYISLQGRKVWLRASYSPVLDNDGEVRKIIQFAREITDLKSAESQMA